MENCDKCKWEISSFQKHKFDCISFFAAKLIEYFEKELNNNNHQGEKKKEIQTIDELFFLCEKKFYFG